MVDLFHLDAVNSFEDIAVLQIAAQVHGAGTINHDAVQRAAINIERNRNFKDLQRHAVFNRESAQGFDVDLLFGENARKISDDVGALKSITITARSNLRRAISASSSCWICSLERPAGF